MSKEMIGDQPKIGSFFKPISSRMHSLKMQEQQILVEETVKKRAEEKAEKEAAKKAQLAAEKSHREQVRAFQLNEASDGTAEDLTLVEGSGRDKG